ncbi:hypothetical protein [Solemya velesiana gill symbiont]|uniref:hypothetical protein n=1 Tax=Solemya velesiana gill symbiont TaxID=1918948 RepID=UPI00155F9BED|nr:hypothetical protein [Solemya velesiana gill symbiont]
MKEHIAKAIAEQTVSARVKTTDWSRYGAFVGLDVHKVTEMRCTIMNILEISASLKIS